MGDTSLVETESPRSVVDSTLKQLVDHFSQPVHSIAANADEERLPYFHNSDDNDEASSSSSLLLLQLSPLARYCFDRLQNLPPSAVVDWVQGYTTRIRPVLLTSTNSDANRYVAVLQQYEKLLTCWRRKNAIHDDDNSKTLTTSLQTETLWHTIRILSTDLTLCSTPTRFSPFHRRNTVLPTLLRILWHVLQLLPNETVVDNNRLVACYCVVSLLALEGEPLDPPTVANQSLGGGRSSTSSTSGSSTDEHKRLCSCSVPPLDADVTVSLDKMLSLGPMDWSDVTLTTTVSIWKDPATNTLDRALQAVWVALHAHFHPPAPITMVDEEILEKDLEPVKRQVLQTVGWSVLARAVRDFFFLGGHGGEGQPNNFQTQPPVTSIVMGRRVTKERVLSETKGYDEFPSRIHAVLNFVRRIPNSSSSSSSGGDEERTDWTVDVASALVPVVLELLGSIHKIHQALGAAALVQLLDQLDEPTATTTNPVWDQQQSHALLAALQSAFSVHRDATVLVTIGEAQVRAFKVFQNNNNNYSYYYNKQRREATGAWLGALRRPAANSFFVLLVVAIIPLLYQQSQPVQAADAMELSRVGLLVLLPLVSGELFDVVVPIKTKCAAMVALINLMVGAHPIMKFHGGKIMSHILACCSIWEKNEDSNESLLVLHALAIHTGGVALVVCGNKFAGPLLDEIEQAENDYRDVLVAFVKDIRKAALEIIQEGRRG